jgi:hypothetical protein
MALKAVCLTHQLSKTCEIYLGLKMAQKSLKVGPSPGASAVRRGSWMQSFAYPLPQAMSG